MKKKEKPGVLDQIVYATECAEADVIVNLYGVGGNALSILGTCLNAMQKAGVSKAAQNAFRTEVLSGDYDHVLRTCSSWCTVVHIAPCSNRSGMAIGAFRTIGLELDA